MKAIQLSAIVIFASVLMGCQIEVTPLGSDQIAGQSTDTTTPASNENDRNDIDTGDTTNPGDTTVPGDTTTPSNTNVSLELTWDIPVERENNEQLFVYEIGGYEIEYRKVGDVSFQTVTIEDGTTNTYAFTELEAGDYEIRIAAFDVNGLYSKFSDSAVLSAI